MLLTKEMVDVAIERVKQKLPQHQIGPDSLSKFNESKVDKEFLGYINGVGGLYMKFIPLLIEELELRNVVELGNREGLSTLAIYDNLSPRASFITVDIVKDQRYCPHSMFTDPRVKFIFGDVCDLSIFDCLASGVPTDIDFLFTDTVHFDYQLRDEWAIYQNLLADRALVAIDDINLNDNRNLFDELDFSKWDLTELCHASGWGLFLYERKGVVSREERLFNAYKTSAVIWRRKYADLAIEMYRIKSKKLMNKTKIFLQVCPRLHRFVIAIKKILS